uniref:Acetylornithine transaminase n=1 Tax=Ananas comosus var. bracteatus TaxID=296719 RepID=A0A6V7QGB3_ANACO|nr:unnamed protein product [Ananas comosus var. bracteatus]
MASLRSFHASSIPQRSDPSLLFKPRNPIKPPNQARIRTISSCLASYRKRKVAPLSTEKLLSSATKEGSDAHGERKRVPFVSVDGKEYLDMTAGIAVNSLGHGDPDWAKAVAEQANTLAHVSNLYYSSPQLTLATRLVDCSFADRVFFTNSGTEANEAAIKFSRKFQKFMHPNERHPAIELVAFTRSFHGRTMGALALTSKEQYREPFEPVMPGGAFVEYGSIEEAKRTIQKGKTAAVFPLAGGLPIGAVLIAERVSSAIVLGDHGSTFAGNPLACHAALVTFNKIQEPSFLDSVRKKGFYLKELLTKKLEGNMHVKEVRGLGLIVGIELDVQASPLVDACREAGLLVLTAGKGNVVRLVPPLIISEKEIELAVEIIAECLPILDPSPS